ncbi:MAG: glucose-1-phosphate thymidylyltransferase [bacterium]
MKALVLSGGKGTRLRPITHTIAKQLVPVANKPILHYCLDNIIQAGIIDIGIVISPETGEFVKKSVNNWKKGHSVNISYILQDQPLGLAHAVKISQDYLKDDSFIMYLGDNLIKENLVKLVERFNINKYDSLILLKEVKNPEMFGVASIKHNKIINLEEKPLNPKSNLALVGVYLFNKNIYKAIDNIKPSKRGELEITEAIQYLLSNSYIVNYDILDGWWLDTGKKDDLLDANRIVLDEYAIRLEEGDICPKTKLEGRVQVHKDSKIINCTIRGPVVIGKNCIVSDSYIGPFTSISDNVIIENSEIEYSVIMKGSKISQIKGRIEESLIGSEVTIECSTGIPHTHKFLIGDHSNIILNA